MGWVGAEARLGRRKAGRILFIVPTHLSEGKIECSLRFNDRPEDGGGGAPCALHGTQFPRKRKSVCRAHLPGSKGQKRTCTGGLFGFKCASVHVPAKHYTPVARQCKVSPSHRFVLPDGEKKFGFIPRDSGRFPRPAREIDSFYSTAMDSIEGPGLAIGEKVSTLAAPLRSSSACIQIAPRSLPVVGKATRVAIRPFTRSSA